MHAVQVDSFQICTNLQMFQSVAVGVLNKCDLRSGQSQKFQPGVGCVCVWEGIIYEELDILETCFLKLLWLPLFLPPSRTLTGH